MPQSKKAMKGVLVMSNVIVGVCALCAVGFGIWVKSSKAMDSKVASTMQSKPMKAFVDKIRASAVVWITCALVVFALSFMGCMGAWKENRAFLATYATIMAVLVIIGIALVVILLGYQTKFKDSAVKGMTRILTARLKYMKSSQVVHATGHQPEQSTTEGPGTSSESPAKKSVAVQRSGKHADRIFGLLERKLRCCGVQGPSDYNNVGGVAKTCSVKDAIDGTLTTFKQGCFNKIDAAIKKNMPVLVTVHAVSILVEMVSMILAILICIKIKQEEDETN